MKFIVDQNSNHQSLAVLRGFFPQHQFDHAFDLGWGALPDVDLFEAMSQKGYDVLLTRDKNQLRVPEERKALIDCGLNWVGYRAGKVGGLLGLALETSTILSGLPHVLSQIDGTPTAFHLKGVGGDIGQRVRVARLM